MDRDSAVTILENRLQRSDTETTSRIITEMQFVQETLLEGAAFLPWFLLSENLTESTIAGEERVQVPNNFLREYEGGALWVYDTAGVKWLELKKDSYDYILNEFPTETEIPQKYALDNDYFRLKPTPDIVYTLRIKCYLRAAVLSTNIENNWLKNASDWLIAEVGAIMAKQHLRNKKLADEFKADAIIAKQRVYIAHEAREHANRDYTMGGPDG